jgi:two-component system sensor histidine kinase UhpB
MEKDQLFRDVPIAAHRAVSENIPERRRRPAGRRQTEVEWAESADRFQSFIEQLPGMSYIVSLDKEDSLIYISPKIEMLLGYSAEQWCRDKDLRIAQLHADDRHRVRSTITRAIREEGAFRIEYRVHARDGSLRWLHDEGHVVKNKSGKPLCLQGAVLDITDRKRAQEELEQSHHALQELISSLDSLRLEEQRRLAHEMHDDFGQLLAAMKLDISTLRQYLPQSDAKVLFHLSSINDLVDTMVVSVRRIIADLPPKMLEDFGLVAGIEAMIANFEKRHGIRCHLRLPEQEPPLDTRMATAIYRMMQEMLNNVAKHAEASEVMAGIDCSQAHIRLRVSDNGRGIRTGSARHAHPFGLIGIRERVAALGGEMAIDTALGKGTSIEISLPMCAPDPSGRLPEA